MATYKVLQDIEAEDKLLGPLTLKQFIFAIITIALGFLCYVFYQINFLLAIPWLLPISFFGFMAAPIGRDQPNDVWLASRIRFIIKPKKRVWDQFGMQELVTITVPKKIEITRTDGLSQTEVRSRLSALSSMMDTRGWVVKNTDGPLSSSTFIGSQSYGERLFDLADTTANKDAQWVTASDDILDEVNNSVAQRIDTTIKQKQSDKIKTLKSNMQKGLIEKPIEKGDITNKEDYSFIFQEKISTEPGYANFGSKVINPGAEANEDLKTEVSGMGKDEEKLLEKIHKNKEVQKHIRSTSHEHRIDPVIDLPKSDDKKESTTNDKAPDAIIKQLSQSNDISIASVASLAKHAEETSFKDDDVISLH